jgi:sulfide dehydrogenase cytochrome subunit
VSRRIRSVRKRVRIKKAADADQLTIKMDKEMIMHRFIQLFLLPLLGLVGVLLVTVAAQSDELSRAAMLSNTCAGCHGTGGISPGSIPSIHCKSADAIEKALKDFRDEKRFSTVMGRHVTGYTDEEIQQIAGFFAAYCDDQGTKQ